MKITAQVGQSGKALERPYCAPSRLAAVLHADSRPTGSYADQADGRCWCGMGCPEWGQCAESTVRKLSGLTRSVEISCCVATRIFLE